MKTFIYYAALLPLLVIAACSDSPTQPDQPQLVASHIAFVDLENGKHALYVQTPSAPLHRISFNGAADDVPGNDPRVPSLSDANILAMRSPRWSPDGSLLALVASTAFDQAEVIVVNADGTHARVVSVNSQYVMGDVDWSPDGKSLVYAMSTRPGAQGLELFVSDLASNSVRQLTTGSGYSGAGGVVRYDATGASVYFSKVTGSQTAAPFNSISAIQRVGATGGNVTTVVSGLIGTVQSIERGATAALVLSNTGWDGTGMVPRQLTRSSFNGASTILATGTALQFAHLTHDDGYALLLTQTPKSGTAYSYAVIPTAGGDPVVVHGVSDASGGMDVRLLKQ